MHVKIEEYPYRYKAFALNVFSDIPISGLSLQNSGKGDIFIQKGIVPEKLDNPLNNGVLFQANENEFLLHLQGLASFFVQKGTNITVEYKNSSENDDISAFLLGTVFGALFHQRRLLPLHGSSVIYNKRCLIFTGISGSGKSTLAAALVQKGARLLADDISLIDFSHNQPEVIPAFPVMKIWEDSLKNLGKNPNNYFPIRKEMKKYLVPIDNYEKSGAPVDHIFILNTHNKNEFEVCNINGIEKFNVLKNNTYFFRGMNKTGILQKHFEHCNKLAQNTKITQIIRPNSCFRIAELVEKMEGFL